MVISLVPDDAQEYPVIGPEFWWRISILLQECRRSLNVIAKAVDIAKGFQTFGNDRVAIAVCAGQCL